MAKRVLFGLVIIIYFLGFPYSGKAQSTNVLEKGFDLSLLRSDETGVLFDLYISNYEIQRVEIDGEEYWQISMPESGTTSEPGKPELPSVSALIGLPPDAQFELNLISDEQEPLAGTYKIIPGQRPAPIQEDFQPGSMEIVQDETAYLSASPYPGFVAHLGEEAWVRDQRLVRVEFYPFQYIPAEGKLILHKHLRAEVKFTYPKGKSLDAPSLTRRSQDGKESPFDSALSSQVLNFEKVKNWRNLAGEMPLAPLSAQERMASDGPRCKIVVNQDGIYKLEKTTLVNSCSMPSGVDPSTFAMTSQGRDVAIFVGNNDGDEHIFDTLEYVLFYGQKFYGDYLSSQFPDEDVHYRNGTFTPPPQDPITGASIQWTPHFSATMMEKYTDDNVYWLKWGGTPGPRINETIGTPGAGDPVATYTTTVHAEQSTRWFTWSFTSEDTWFWDRIVDTGTHTYTTQLTAISTDPFSATVRGEIVGKFDLTHNTEIKFNTITEPITNQQWKGKSRYTFSKKVSGADLVNGSNQLKIKSLIDDEIYFDWFEIEYARKFRAEDDELWFSKDEGGSTSKYQVNNLSSSDIAAYDISDPLHPQQIISPTIESGITFTYTFTGTHVGIAEYYILTADRILTPASISYYNPPDLYSSTGAEYIFITHPAFYTSTQTLANYRESQGMSTMVVNVDDVYNEFLFGIYHPLAIKEFLKFAWDNYPTRPEYVLLIGDGHWNFKGYPNYGSSPIFMPPNLAWVDPWQGEVDSTNLLATLSGNDPLPDVSIGRLPVNSIAEFNAFYNKLIAYEAKPGENWQWRFLFIADNQPDSAGWFKDMSNRIIDSYKNKLTYVDRIYQNDFSCPPTGNCQAVRNAITQTLNITGTLVMNYIGHGSVRNWSGENIFNTTSISTLNNGIKFPIVLSMTCLDGYWYHPEELLNPVYNPGLQELMVRANNKGSIAAFAPEGLGGVQGHDELHRGFYDSFPTNGSWILGPATQSAKLRLYNNDPYETYVDLIHTFVILGDPATHIVNRHTVNLPLLRK